MADSLTDPAGKLNSPFTFSQSSLQDYSDCPRRFQLRYIDRLAWPAVESEPVAEFELRQAEGRTFHRLVQQHLLGISTDRLAKLADTPNLRRWWGNYIAADLGLHAHTRRAELSLICGVGHHRLVAKYDMVAVLDDTVIILDWKTSTKRPQDEVLAAFWQTRVYRAVMARAGGALVKARQVEPERIKMTYWFAEFPNDPAHFHFDAQQLQRDWSAIERLIQEVSAKTTFPRTDDLKMCRFCVYRSYCDRGSAADEHEDAGEGLEDNFDVSLEQIGEIEF